MRKHNFPLNVFIIFVSIATTELSSPNNRLTSQCHETKTMTENIVCCFDFHEELEMHAIHILFLCVCVWIVRWVRISYASIRSGEWTKWCLCVSMSVFLCIYISWSVKSMCKFLSTNTNERFHSLTNAKMYMGNEKHLNECAKSISPPIHAENINTHWHKHNQQ